MAKVLIVGNPSSPLVRARGLIGQAAGHEIFWFSSNPAELEGVTSYSLPIFFRKSVLRAIAEPFFLARAIKKIGPDLIHVHYAFKGLAALVLAKLHPLIVSVMGSDILPGAAYRFPYSLFTKHLLEAADAITSKSDFMDQALLAIGNYAPKIRRINWGVDLSVFIPGLDSEAIRLKWAIPTNNLVFLDPRNATPFYNKHIILEGFARYLRTEGKPATLLILEQAGQPKYVARLMKMAEEFGVLQNVRFVGTVSPTEMAQYYSLADITISIPNSDGLPQSIYEALACGSFLVLVDLEQYRGVVIDTITAKLIQNITPDEIAIALAWSVDHAEIRKNAQGIGRAYVEREADKSKQATILLDLYDELLEKKT